jgi:hypothetical protein
MTPTVSIERPSPNLTLVQIGPSLEFAFSYQTIIAFRGPTNPKGSWAKSENVWTVTTGKHLDSLPGQRIPHDVFQRHLNGLIDVLAFHLSNTPPVGQTEHGPSDLDLARKYYGTP